MSFANELPKIDCKYSSVFMPLWSFYAHECWYLRPYTDSIDSDDNCCSNMVLNKMWLQK